MVKATREERVALDAIAKLLRENLDSDATAPSDVLADIAEWVEFTGRDAKPVTDQVPCRECGALMTGHVMQLDGRCSGCGDYARDCVCDQVCAVCEEGGQA